MNKPNLPSNWDERYAMDEYRFGTEPNDFLRASAAQLPLGKTLCLADGEGRNGVFLASLGHQVTGVDMSAVGLEKARALATRRQVNVSWEHADLVQWDMGEACWDCIVSIFFHLPPPQRSMMHQRMQRALRPGGMIVLEAYTPAQLTRDTGGPPSAEVLMTLAMLREDFAGMSLLLGQEIERPVIEGNLHTGDANVVQLLAVKPDNP